MCEKNDGDLYFSAGAECLPSVSSTKEYTTPSSTQLHTYGRSFSSGSTGNMSQLSDIIREVLKKILPYSLMVNSACFMFYDHHPNDQDKLDVIICTKNGELMELYDREVVSSINLECLNVSKIDIFRNSKAKRFYLVSTEEDLLIISKRDTLVIHKKIENVEVFDINDTDRKGQAFLKVIRKDSVVPLMFDDNLESLWDRTKAFNSSQTDESLPLFNNLRSKLVEAKYTLKHNKKNLEEFVTLRQLVAFSSYQNISPNLSDSAIQTNPEQIDHAIKIKTSTPWIKTCNKKIILVVNVWNQNDLCLQDFHVLVHADSQHAVHYSTRLFVKMGIPPFWEENKTQILMENSDTTVVLVIDAEEIKSKIISKIEISSVMVFKKAGKDYAVPLNKVFVSLLDTMGQDFDVFTCTDLDNKQMLLAVLATTKKTELCLRYIQIEGELDVEMHDVFFHFLRMEKLPIADGLFMFKKLPFHILYGILLCFKKFTTMQGVKTFNIAVYSRTPSQVLTLTHFIKEAVPLKIIVTTLDYKINALDKKLFYLNEEVVAKIPNFNHFVYSTSMLKRLSFFMDYLHSCVLKMSVSNNPDIQRRIETEVDVFAGGFTEFEEFRRIMWEEARNGLELFDLEV